MGVVGGFWIGHLVLPKEGQKRKLGVGIFVRTNDLGVGFMFVKVYTLLDLRTL